jgi:hypothetical protein
LSGLLRDAGAGDRGLDDEVGRAADQHQMLDIVAANQNQAPPVIDGQRVDDRQPRQPATRRQCTAAPPVAADQPHNQPDQGENDDQRYEILDGHGSILAEDRNECVAHYAPPDPADTR